MNVRREITACVTLTWLDTSKRWLVVAADVDGHTVSAYADTTAEVGSAGLLLLCQATVRELQSWLPY
jgi:hypothetical protein